jgi:hypothetical protein
MSRHISRELRSTNKKNKKSSKTKNTESTRKVKKTTKKSHKTSNTEIETERVSQDLVQDSLQISTSGNSNLVSNTERSILGEKDANEPQVLVDNVEQESGLEKNSNDTNNKQSFIWNYLEKLPPTERYKKRVKCLVKISGQVCGHIMGSDGSTGNFIFHLAKHSITRDGDLSQQNNENVEETQNNSAKKNRLDKKFVGIIINLTGDEWVAIKQLIIILKPFASATELLEGSKYATISFIYDAITEITNGLINSSEINPEEIDLTNPTTVFDNDIGIEDPDDDDEVDDHPKRRKISINTPQDCNDLIGKVRSALYIAMKHYWNVPQDEGLIAEILDPRCKYLGFVSESQVIRTKNLLREIYEKAKEDLGVVQQQQQSQSPGNSLLRNIFANRYRSERRDEIEGYMMMEETDFSTCPFKWWASQKSRFPILSQLAKKYLAIPATSASSERLFSDAGNVMTVRRTNLLPSTFEYLVFCKRNWRLIGKIFPESE